MVCSLFSLGSDDEKCVLNKALHALWRNSFHQSNLMVQTVEITESYAFKWLSLTL